MDSVRVAPEEVALPLAGIAGRRVIVAGGASGIGRAAALKFGRLGADVKSLAREVTRFGVRVNCVSPGPTDTPLFHAATAHQQGIVQTMLNLTPMKRMAQPEEPADALVFLASDSAG